MLAALGAAHKVRDARGGGVREGVRVCDRGGEGKEMCDVLSGVHGMCDIGRGSKLAKHSVTYFMDGPLPSAGFKRSPLHICISGISNLDNQMNFTFIFG